MEWWHYLLTFIGSGAFVSLLQLYFTRMDAKKDKAQSYDKRFDTFHIIEDGKDIFSNDPEAYGYKPAIYRQPEERERYIAVFDG